MNIREFQHKDGEAVSRFMNRHFLQGVTNEVRSHEARYYRWKYKKTPWGKPVAFVAVHEERIVGLFAILPRSFHCGEASITIGETCDAYVAPEFQGKGIGKLLVSRWVKEAYSRGAKGCYLTTDAEKNESVNSFYRSLGWMIESTYVTPEGRRMNRFVYDFGSSRQV